MTNESASSKPSRLAFLSFIFGAVLWLLWCLLYGTLGIMAENNTLDEGTGLIGFVLGPMVLGVITLVLGITGAVLGIRAVRRKDPKRGLAIAGLVLNFICLIPLVLLLVAMLVAGVSSLPDFIDQLMHPVGT